MECIFCGIVEKKLPSTIVYEDDEIMVFPDIHPKARIHLLLVPKEHIGSLAETTAEHGQLLGALLARAREIARSLGIGNSGYKVVVNTGEEGGQVIGHLHLHLLGGEMVRTLV